MQQLAQRLPRQRPVEHRRAAQMRYTQQTLGRNREDTEIAQGSGVAVKASRIGPHQRAAEQTLAAKQLQIAPVGQRDQLVAVTVGFQHSATCDQILVGRREELLKGGLDCHCALPPGFLKRERGKAAF